MSFSPSLDDLDELPMPEEWREVADLVLPGNREQMADGGWPFGLVVDCSSFSFRLATTAPCTVDRLRVEALLAPPRYARVRVADV